MGITMAYIQENQESRTMTYTAESGSTTRKYHLFDYVDTSDALAALVNYVPNDIYVHNYQCVLPEFDINPVFSDPERTLYEASVTWKTADIAAGGGGGGGDDSPDDPKEPEDDTSFSFSFSGVSEVTQQSIEQGNGEGSRGFDTKGNVQSVPTSWINQQNPSLPPEGVEVNRPVTTMTAKTVVSGYVASNDWFRERMNQVWTTNNSTWRGLEKHCVMFTGMDGVRRGDGHWNITYNFEYRPMNEQQKFLYWTSKATAPSYITIPRHSGWTHVDARYNEVQLTSEDGYDDTKRSLSNVQLHHVYGESDFNQLGMIGV